MIVGFIISIVISLVVMWVLVNRDKIFGRDSMFGSGSCGSNCNDDRPKKTWGSKNPSLKLKDKLNEKYKY